MQEEVGWSEARSQKAWLARGKCCVWLWLLRREWPSALILACRSCETRCWFKAPLVFGLLSAYCVM